MKKILISAVTAVATILVCFGLFIQPAKADVTNSVVVYLGTPGGNYQYLDNTYTNSSGFSNGVPASYNGGSFSAGFTTNIQIVTSQTTATGKTNTLVIKNGLVVGITQGP